MLGFLRSQRHRINAHWATLERTLDPTQDDANLRAERINVLNLLRGVTPLDPKRRSLLFFSVHRGGSSFVGSLLTWVADNNQITPVNLEAHCYNYSDELLKIKYGHGIGRSLMEFGQPGVRGDAKALRDLFRPHGYYYGALRDPFLLQKLPHRDEFTILLMLRDPRDVLTSLYFSIAHSHTMPNKNPDESENLTGLRGALQQITIDDYVITAVPTVLGRFEVYLDILAACPTIHLLRYEDMVLDYPRWVDRVAELWGVPATPEGRQELINAGNFSVDREDPHAHKRQVYPGDHRRKLKPDTIARLNESFAEVLAALDYPLDDEMPHAA